MRDGLIMPWFPVDTFGGAQYELDTEESLSYRTPFQDVDSKRAEAMFDAICHAERQS